MESPLGSPAEGWQITHESPRYRKVEMDYDAKRAEYFNILAAAEGDAVILGHFGGLEPHSAGAIFAFAYGNGLASMESSSSSIGGSAPHAEEPDASSTT